MKIIFTSEKNENLYCFLNVGAAVNRQRGFHGEGLASREEIKKQDIQNIWTYLEKSKALKIMWLLSTAFYDNIK